MMQKAFNLAVIVLLLAVFVTNAEAQTPTALAGAKLLPEGELAVRQRCELAVRFLSDGFAFSGAPSFPDIQIEGAIVVPPRSGMNLTERRSGQTWMGVERRYSVYPTRTGELIVPSITIGASVRNSNGVTDVTAKSESLVRQVVIPSVLSNHLEAIITSKLILSQRFEPDVNELKVGDAIKRTVIVTAENTVAMLLPHLLPAEHDGLKEYPDQPVLNDREYRGSLTATRTDSVTYIAQKQGHYELSPISVFWWDPEQGQVREAAIPALGLTVLANPLWAGDPNDPNTPVQTEIEVTTPSGGSKYLITTAAVIFFLFLIGWWLLRRHGHTIRGIITDFRVHCAESEKAYFQHFRQACLANDPQAALRTLLAWLDRQSEFSGVTTLEDFAGQVGYTELSRLINDLHARLFGKDVNVSLSWSGEDLARAVARARRKGRKQHSRTQKDVGLCPLNPSA
ncbi:MAG: BatD family protein [Phycisphaerales bacterium]|nr:MAG: BatD family protein [Phycisphaerales bacterium]